MARPARGDTHAIAPDAMAPRWKGQDGRLEVWYASITDPETGAGCWIHHETVAPLGGAAYAHGWVVVFPTGSPPVLERFGPDPVPALRAAGAVSSTAATAVEPPALWGTAGRVTWEMHWVHEIEARPLFTFPAWAWSRDVLPAAAVVPVADACFVGSIEVDGVSWVLSPRARGGVGHIYGHGNAQRWGWLHAGLGDGDVLEIVSAVSRRPVLDHLPPLAFVQLRRHGRDWPRHPLAAAPLFRTHLDHPTWRVHGTVGRWRLRVEATLPEPGTVAVGYVDPDGATATCTNSEIADATIVLERRRRNWEVEGRWHLQGTAHTEIGVRP